jgi:type I restriction enzyme, S subunit
MNNSPWPMVKIGSLLKRSKERVEILPHLTYKQVTVRLWGKGVILRNEVSGTKIRAKTRYVARPGQFILSRIDARNGAMGLVPDYLDGAVLSNDFPVFDMAHQRLTPRFLEWMSKTRAFVALCQADSEGTTNRVRLQLDRFSESEIPLPPLAEQRRIVARIEALAAKVEAARQLREEVMEEAELVLGANLREIFRRFEDREDCEHTTLGKATKLQRGKFSHRPRNDPMFFGGAHPWIQIGEIGSADKYITDYTETLNDAGLKISRKFPKGTLLISIAATIGAVGILTFDCCMPDSIVAVMPYEDKATSEFLYYYLLYVRSYLEEIAPQSAQKNINLRILNPLPISLPALPEQRRIVAHLDALQAKLGAVQAHQAATQTRLEALLPSLLDQAFRGEL